MAQQADVSCRNRRERRRINYDGTHPGRHDFAAWLPLALIQRAQCAIVELAAKFGHAVFVDAGRAW